MDIKPPIGPTLGFGTDSDRRAAAEQALAEREEWRAQQILLQAAPDKDPQERIKLWEELHGLELPRAANHKLLAVIAAQTRLPLSDVLAEQVRRAEWVAV